LKNVLLSEQKLSDDTPMKGAIIRQWLTKKEVIFARTSQEQKLLIIHALQSLSHCVGVIGEGIHDSPALKRADVGIALQSGTSLAKDSADMVLLDDDFENIIRGVKQGRHLFDVLRRLIRYNITTYLSRLLPFAGFVILSFPLPMTIAMILCFEFCTNLLPNVLLAYEESDKDLLNKQPRDPKKDKLCTLNMLSYSYLYVGVIQAATCFLTYFTILNDYGLNPSNHIFMNLKDGVLPALNDVFNPYDDEYNGNTVAFILSNTNLLGFYGESHKVYNECSKITMDFSDDQFIGVDLRLFFYNESQSYWRNCGFDSRGLLYDGYVCFRPAAIRHAQTGYFTALILMQVISSICIRLKSSSLKQYKFKNIYLTFGYLAEILILMFFMYTPGVNESIGLRGLRVEHWAPCFGMFIMFYVFEEITKYYIRNVKTPDNKPSWFQEYYSY
jgi:sodium/potassium-transporting ATPase subunit alpha